MSTVNCQLISVICHLSPVTCPMSPVTWPPLYAPSAAMKIPKDLRMQLQETLAIDRRFFLRGKIKPKKLKSKKYLFKVYKEVPLGLKDSIPLRRKIHEGMKKQRDITTYRLNWRKGQFIAKLSWYWQICFALYTDWKIPQKMVIYRL